MAHLEKILDGKWRVVVEIPGYKKRKRAVRIVNASRQKAEEVMHELASRVNSNKYIEPSNISVYEWLLRWYKSKEHEDLEDCTLENYLYTINGRIKEQLGDMKLSKLRPHHIQTYLDRQHEEKLAPRTIKMDHMILNAALNLAENLEVISRNPVSSVKSPKLKRSEVNYFTPEQIKAVLKAAREYDYADGYAYMEDLIVFTLHTGLRKGEVLGLKWDCVDFTNKNITIHRELGKGGRVKESTKNKSSRRTLSINNTVANILNKKKKEQAGFYLLLGTLYEDRNLIFCKKDGTPLNYDYVNELFGKFVKKAGISGKYTFHSLRHSHATLLHQIGGVDLKDIQERLGHASLSTTADVYTKADTTKREVADKMEEIL